MNLMTLCDAAVIVEMRDAAVKETQTQSKEPNVEDDVECERIQSKIKKYNRQKSIACYIDNTSDELSKRFSYRCKYSPLQCSRIAESYGSELKALAEITDHIIFEHMPKEFFPKSREVVKDSSEQPCCFKKAKTAPQRRSNKGQSTSQEPASKKKSFVNNFIFDHEYAKSGDELSLPSFEAERNKNVCATVKAFQDCSEFWKEINDPPKYRALPHVPTGPFPFVHHPEPLEPAAVVEFYPNGEPVNVIQPVRCCERDNVDFKRKLENLANKRKSKFLRMGKASRSVLECVENRVTYKPSSSSEQRDAPVPLNGIENAENLEEIAVKNIRILMQQKKRRFRVKPSVYICELCNKHFTANTSLTYHYMAHLNMKPFGCSICPKAFTRRHSLKYHMMIHNDVSRFQCEFCERKFRHPSHFKEHLRKHNGEEPYSCKLCSNNFKTRNSYKRHFKSQHQKILISDDIVPICEDN